MQPVVPESVSVSHENTKQLHASMFTDILRFQHLCNILVIVNIIQQKFFHVKAIYHISQLMLIAKETCSNLTDLDSLLLLSRKTAWKAVLPSVRYTQYTTAAGKPPVLPPYRSGSSDTHFVCSPEALLPQTVFLSVCNTDDSHRSIRNPRSSY